MAKFTHSPRDHPITALDARGRHARGDGGVNSLSPHVSPSHAPFFLLSAWLPVQIHITCIACDVISFNGQEQLCFRLCAGRRDLSMIQSRGPEKKAKKDRLTWKFWWKSCSTTHLSFPPPRTQLVPRSVSQISLQPYWQIGTGLFNRLIMAHTQILVHR